MSNAYEIPLKPGNQTLNINLNGTIYNLTILWRNGYFLDIYDINNNPLITGISLVTGCNLLGQHQYLGIVPELVIITDTTPDNVPTKLTLGVSSHLAVIQ